jgi:imidazolonepropionase-like amidohydrolase
MRIFAAIFCLLFSLTLTAQTTYIHCGKLIDGNNNNIQSEMTIVIEGNKITDVLKGYQTNASAKIIDLKNRTVMPGLIDAHVHLRGETSKDRYTEGFTLNTEDFAYRSVRYAEITLMSGFTTVRDCGGEIIVGMRNAINAGFLKGPRILAAGKIIATTGGHGDGTNGVNRDLMGDPDPRDGIINNPDEARKAVRQHYKEGSDFIKITATGGVLSNAKDGAGAQFTDDEIRAIVTTAKDYGFRVAAHAHGAEGMKRAIRAGVTSIEHGTFMDDEAISLMKQYGTWLVPTIIAGKSTADSAKIPGYYPPFVAAKAAETGPKIQATFARAYKAGVKIAFGTDAGVFKHGQNYKEFGYMVEAGMPPMVAIQSATIKGAELLGLLDKIGSIEKGKLADVIAVDGDPIQNIAVMKNVTFVMKEGVVYKKEN